MQIRYVCELGILANTIYYIEDLRQDYAIDALDQILGY